MGKQVVGYVAGVFDLFHVGHLRHLSNAKAFCDKLIVGVITDEIIEEYKGIKAVIPFQQRIEIVRALRCVDVAMECRTRDYYKQWQQLKFDIVLCSDDWCEDPQYVEWENELEELGVPTMYLPRTSSISSSDIRKRIRSIP